MTLHKATLESVKYVAANMRAADREEIHPLWFNPTPEGFANVVMARPGYVWLAARGVPIAVFGMIETRPRAWQAFAFGTDDFPKVASEMTKFLLRKVRPHLFDELGAVRVEAHSHGNHTEAHRWLRLLGAKPTEDQEYGPEGETYLHFVMRRSDFQVTKRTKALTIVASGGKPDFARSAAS